MSKSNLFISATISFALGIYLGSLFQFEKGLIFLTAGFVFVWWFISKKTKLFFWCLIFICLGLWRINVASHDTEFKLVYDTKQEYQAVIIQDPDIRPNKQLITLRPQNYNQNILATTTTAEKFSYGDLVLLSGKIKQPQSFDDFDYAGYLARYNVYAQMQYPKIIVLKQKQGNFVRQPILELKSLFVKKIGTQFSEPSASLLLGILIGAKKTLPQSILDQFSKTGTSHIVAVSGYNISVLVGALGFLAIWIGRKGSILLSLLIVIIFTLAAGAGASVMRASVMGIILILSFNSGRLYSITPSLCFAGGVMLLFNPKILYFDIGFQLSFLATCGIVYILPLFELLTVKWQKFKIIKNTLLVTLSATIATFPIIILNFGTASFISPVVNMLILPVVPLVMFFGFFSLLPIIGTGFSLFAKLLLDYILFVVNKASFWPGAGVELEVPTWLVVVISGLVLFAIITWYRLNIDQIRNLAEGSDA